MNEYLNGQKRSEKSSTIQIRINNWLKYHIKRISVSKVLSECGHYLIRLTAERGSCPRLALNICTPGLPPGRLPSRPPLSIWVSEHRNRTWGETAASGNKEDALYHWSGSTQTFFVQTLAMMWPLDKSLTHSTHWQWQTSPAERWGNFSRSLGPSRIVSVLWKLYPTAGNCRGGKKKEWRLLKNYSKTLL